MRVESLARSADFPWPGTATMTARRGDFSSVAVDEVGELFQFVCPTLKTS